MRLLRYQDYREVPWKNGGGVTREIAIGNAPDGSGFLWRLSMATVAASGPFSAFPGIDRTICCLEGDGMRLSFGDGRTIDLESGWAPLEFSGEDAVHADCLGGETLDLNVMTRRQDMVHEMKRLVPAGEITVPPGAGIRAVVLTAPADIRSAAGTTSAGRFDTVLFEGETAPVTLTAATGVEGFLITIASRAKG